MPIIRGDRYWLSRPDPRRPDYEVVTSVSVDDILSGTSEADIIHGGYGHNVIRGGGGNDELRVDGGSAIPVMAWAADVLAFLSSQAAIGYGALYGEAGNDALIGSAKADILDGGSDDDDISGGGGDDTIYASTGRDSIAGGSGFDSLFVTADGDLSLRGLNGLELISAAGFRNVALVGNADQQFWDFTTTTLSGIDRIAAGGGGDSIRGSAGNDVIWAWGALTEDGRGDTVNGGAGNDWIRLMPSLENEALLEGGAGADTFDLTFADAQIRSFPRLRIYGADSSSNPPINGDGADDTLLLRGSPDQYEFSWSGGRLDYFQLSATAAGLLPPFESVDLYDIQKLRFTDLLANHVEIGDLRVDGRSAESNLVFEQLRLIEESYGWLKPLTHPAEAMASVSHWETGLAAQRGWHRLSPLELGLAPKGTLGDVAYIMDRGKYLATTPNPLAGFDDPPQAVATVFTGIVNGERTLAVTFRGTDQYADFTDYLDLGNHYRKLAPLIAAIDAYVADPANGIEQVLLSGHSLGGAMVQEFMAQHLSGPPGVVYRGVTIGSPGSDNPDRTEGENRIVNFGHSGDPIFQIGFGDNDAVAKAALMAFAAIFAPPLIATAVLEVLAQTEDKHRQGPNVTINDSRYNWSLFGEHDPGLYLDSLRVLLAFAYDGASPFSKTDLAAALVASTPYAGVDLQIAVINSGTKTAHTSAADRYVLGSGADDTIRVATRGGQVIDGGLGKDKIVLFDALGSLTWQRSGERVTLWEDGQLTLDLTRVEAMVRMPSGATIDFHAAAGSSAAQSPASPLPPLLTYFDGRSPVVQTGTAGGRLDMRADADYALTGRAASVHDTQSEDLIVVDGVVGKQDIYLGGGDDLLLVGAGAVAAGGVVNVFSGAGNDVLVNAGVSAGTIAFVAGYRTDWAVVLGANGNVTLARLALDGVFEVQLLGDIRVRFWEDAGPARPTESFAPVFGNTADNLLQAEAEASYLSGGNGDDVLFGSDFDDILNGDNGRDELHGGPGDDLYRVAADDLVFEQAGGGIDTVYVTDSHVMPANVENVLIVSGIPALVAVLGNAEDNVIRALYSGSYDLRGGDGDDSIHAADRNDVLAGDLGDDLLDGGAGADSLDGGGGRDWLIGGEGADMAAGGAGHDSVWGGAGDDLLDGGAGDDTIDGGAGSDIVSYAAAASRVEIDLAWLEDQNTRGAGFDTLISIENVVGSAFGDSIAGNSAPNRLDGKGGADLLSGSGGPDSFAFTSAPGGGNVDRIADFVPGTDRIALGHAVFGLGTGALDPNALFLTGTAAHDGDDRIVYNRATGALFFDADGNGAIKAIQFATVTPGLALSVNDFFGL